MTDVIQSPKEQMIEKAFFQLCSICKEEWHFRVFFVLAYCFCPVVPGAFLISEIVDTKHQLILKTLALVLKKQCMDCSVLLIVQQLLTLLLEKAEHSRLGRKHCTKSPFLFSTLFHHCICLTSHPFPWVLLPMKSREFALYSLVLLDSSKYQSY